MTIDAAFFATVDPATVLFTAVSVDEPLGAVTEQFLANEFGQADVNKFATLAAARDPVSSLGHATKGDWASSARYAEVMRPLGLGDELRAALVSNGRCWGVICLHREDADAGFSEQELQLVRRLTPHLAEGLRRGLRAGSMETADVGPGVVVLDADLRVESISAEAEHWLAELDPDRRSELPVAVRAVAAQLMRVQELPGRAGGQGADEGGPLAGPARLDTSRRWRADRGGDRAGHSGAAGVVPAGCAWVDAGSAARDGVAVAGVLHTADRRAVVLVAAHRAGTCASGVRQGRRRQSPGAGDRVAQRVRITRMMRRRSQTRRVPSG